MTIGDILDGAFRGLRAGFLPIGAVVLLFMAPLQLLTNLALSRLAPSTFGASLFDVPDGPTMMNEFEAVAGISIVAGMISFVIELVVGVAVLALVLQIDRGEMPRIGDAVSTGLRRAPTTLAAGVLLVVLGIALLVLGMLGLVVAAVVPVLGPILMVLAVVALAGLFVALFSLIVPIAVVEHRGPIGTLARVFWVLRVRFWRLIGITWLMLFVVGVATFAVALPFTLLALFAGPAAWVVESVGQIVGSVVRVPVIALAALLVYLDARVRFEGFDLQLRAQRLSPATWTAR